MTNKTVKNRDLTTIILERQNNTDDNIAFSDIKNLCCKFGFFTQLGFLSTAIFRHLPFIEVDFTPYLNALFPQNGVLLEAFNCRPCLYISDVLVCQRQDNQRVCGKTMSYVLSVYVLRMFKVLASKKVLEYSIIEQIKEQLLGDKERTLADLILSNFEQIVKQGGMITESEWLNIMEIFFHFKSLEYKKRILQIFSGYTFVVNIGQPGVMVRKENEDNHVESDKDFSEVYYRFGEGRYGNVDSINLWLTVDKDRWVIILKRMLKCYWNCYRAFRSLLHRVTTPAMRRLMRRLLYRRITEEQ